MQDKVTCSYPFDSFFLYTNGDVKFCCASDVVLGNIQEDSLRSILHNHTACSIRKQILTGNWHEGNCSYCKNIELSGGTSQRNPIELSPEITEQTFTLKNFDPRWSNTCNLSCVYCDSYFSSKWAAIKKEYFSADKEITQQNVFDFIQQSADTIEKIQLLGGEPLLLKENSKLIDILPEKNYYVLSNLTIPLEENSTAQKFLNSTNVEWGVSFETIGDRFEYVRHNASWETFTHNLRYITSKTGKKLNAHPVYFLLSALSLLEYCDFVFESDLFNNVHWQLLTVPNTLSIFSQSDDIRKSALKQLDLCISKYEHTQYENIKDLMMFRDTILGDKLPPKGNTIDWINTLETKLLHKKVTAKTLWEELT